MKELRDIKLDLLMGNQNPIVDLFNEITSGIKIINCNVYNEDGLEFIYHKDGQWIFYFAYAKSAKHYQDVQNEKFWCNFSTYWSLFESKLGLEYLEIQAITKYCFTISQSEYLVEDALKRELSTPSGSNPCKELVEETLKREVSTPRHRKYHTQIVLEDTLKRENEFTIWF